VEGMQHQFYYRIGTHRILLEPAIRAEVLVAQALYPLPFSPEWCAGLISLRGELFPVLDMHRMVQGQAAPAQAQLLLIQHPQFSPVAMTCDGYPQQAKLSAAHLVPIAGENLPSWIPHTLQYDAETLLAADHGRLLRHLRRLSGT